MNEFVMKDFGFTALDPVARCAISGGDSEYGILGELLEDLLEGLASKLGAAGILVSMLQKTLTALLMDSEPVGTKTNEEDECERKCTRFCVAKRRCVLRSNRRHVLF